MSKATDPIEGYYAQQKAPTIPEMRQVLMDSCSWSAKDVQDLSLDDLYELYRMLEKDRLRQEVDQ